MKLQNDGRRYVDADCTILRQCVWLVLTVQPVCQCVVYHDCSWILWYLQLKFCTYL